MGKSKGKSFVIFCSVTGKLEKAQRITKILFQKNHRRCKIKWQNQDLGQTFEIDDGCQQMKKMIMEYYSYIVESKNNSANNIWSLIAQNKKRSSSKKNKKIDYKAIEYYTAKEISELKSQQSQILKIKKEDNYYCFDYLIDCVYSVFLNESNQIIFILKIIDSQKVICVTMLNMLKYFPQSLWEYYEEIIMLNQTNNNSQSIQNYISMQNLNNLNSESSSQSQSSQEENDSNNSLTEEEYQDQQVQRDDSQVLSQHQIRIQSKHAKNLHEKKVPLIKSLLEQMEQQN